jgi:hypothetical protein
MRAASITSLPTPSPGIQAIRYFGKKSSKQFDQCRVEFAAGVVRGNFTANSTAIETRARKRND